MPMLSASEHALSHDEAAALRVNCDRPTPGSDNASYAQMRCLEFWTAATAGNRRATVITKEG